MIGRFITSKESRHLTWKLNFQVPKCCLWYVALFFLLTPALASASLTDGLVGYWTFDGKDVNWATGGATDRSGNGNHGGIVGMSTSTAPVIGKLGQGLKFDGVDDSIRASDSLSLDVGTNMSVSAWVKFNVVGGDEAIIFKGLNGIEYAAYKLGFGILDGSGTVGKINFTVRTGSGASGHTATWGTVPTVGVWYHFVGTHDGTNVKLYVNGVQVDSQAGNVSAPYNGSTVLQMGADDSGTPRYKLIGALDDVRIYNRALSATEIKQLYNYGAAKLNVSPTQTLTSGLVGYWTFDGKDTNWATGRITDRSGNGNHGGVVGMSTTSSPTIGKLEQGFRFDGSNDYIDTNQDNGYDFDSITFSVMGWFKTTSTTNGYILGKFGDGNIGGWGVGVNNDVIANKFAVVVKNSDASTNCITRNSASSVNDGRWHHFVAVITTGASCDTTIYIDGVVNQSAPTALSGASNGSSVSNLFIGKRTLGNFLNGNVDDVRIYNRALSAKEIKQLYTMGSGAKFSPCRGQTTATDQDGNVYNTVAIGAQCWMKQNMRVGTRINGATAQSNNGTVEKYCYSDSDANCTSNNPNQPDGGLYQWSEAMQYVTTPGARGICPIGWHIPTDAEQYTLENFLKTPGATCNPNRSGAYDCDPAGTKLQPGVLSGFEGNLAGVLSGGSFFFRGTNGYFWSSTESGSVAWSRYLYSGSALVFRNQLGKSNGLSVRCLKDS